MKLNVEVPDEDVEFFCRFCVARPLQRAISILDELPGEEADICRENLEMCAQKLEDLRNRVVQAFMRAKNEGHHSLHQG